MSFNLGGLQGTKKTGDLGGYAILGAVCFLVAGVLLQRKLAQGSQGGGAIALQR